MRSSVLNNLFARGGDVDPRAMTASALDQMQVVFREDDGRGAWLDPQSAEHELLDSLLGAVHLLDDVVRLAVWQLWHPHHGKVCVVCGCEAPPGMLTFLPRSGACSGMCTTMQSPVWCSGALCSCTCAWLVGRMGDARAAPRCRCGGHVCTGVQARPRVE